MSERAALILTPIGEEQTGAVTNRRGASRDGDQSEGRKQGRGPIRASRGGDQSETWRTLTALFLVILIGQGVAPRRELEV
eukprot:2869353-Pyramimonas_sp.AAC.1